MLPREIINATGFLFVSEIQVRNSLRFLEYYIASKKYEHMLQRYSRIEIKALMESGNRETLLFMSYHHTE